MRYYGGSGRSCHSKYQGNFTLWKKDEPKSKITLSKYILQNGDMVRSSLLSPTVDC